MQLRNTLKRSYNGIKYNQIITVEKKDREDFYKSRWFVEVKCVLSKKEQKVIKEEEEAIKKEDIKKEEQKKIVNKKEASNKEKLKAKQKELDNDFKNNN